MSDSASFFDEESSQQGLLSKEHDEYREKPVRSTTAASSWFLKTLVLLVLLALSTSNVVLLVRNRKLSRLIEPGYTGIFARGKHPETFHTYTEYSDVNETVSDAAWARFTTNGFVALSHEWAAQHRLPPAQRFPDDSSKGVYVLDAFHNIHCVIYLRETIKQLRRGGNVDDRLIHINHCYDALRQSIRCRADDTPLQTPYGSRLTGDGQVRQCRDWDALTRWARDHTACWPTGRCADVERLEETT